MSEPYVEINQGALQGKTVNTTRGDPYYSFQGIPYAKPPIGNLRFKAPQPPEAWKFVLDATKEGNVSYQRDMISHQEIGSEDCLFLNVYTNELPKRDAEVLRPVMVWIHGGGLVIGSGNTDLYGPDYLIYENVVVVTINYRLGLLGFLCVEDESLDIPGNAGLKDMVMALKWVQANIHKFGGDPNNVTIFGESSGGWAVHFLVLSPLAKGLFHRAVIQSGCALNPRAWGTRGVQHISEILNYQGKTETEIVNLLRSYSTKELFQLQQKLNDDYRTDQPRAIGPVIETSSGPSNFISSDPLELIKSGNFNHVPLILGYVSREGMLMIGRATSRGQKIPLIKKFERLVPYNLNIPRDSEMFREIANKIKKFYFGKEEPSSENIDSMLQLYTDAFFLRGLYVSAVEHAKASTQPVYFYRFSVDAGLNWYKKLTKVSYPGAAHCDELGYLFTTSLTKAPQVNSVEDTTIKRMTKLWTSFAQSGDPNPKKLNKFINTKWLPVTNSETHFLDIGENLTIGKSPEALRMEFWDNLP